MAFLKRRNFLVSYYYKFIKAYRNPIPTTIAMAKLINVPDSIYSVSFLSFALVRSPKRKMDFAASKYPIPSKKPMFINKTMSNRSVIPMTFPAFLSDSFLRVFFLKDSLHFLKNSFMAMEVTDVIKSNAITQNSNFSTGISEKNDMSENKQNTIVANTKRCNSWSVINNPNGLKRFVRSTYILPKSIKKCDTIINTIYPKTACNSVMKNNIKSKKCTVICPYKYLDLYPFLLRSSTHFLGCRTKSPTRCANNILRINNPIVIDYVLTKFCCSEHFFKTGFIQFTTDLTLLFIHFSGLCGLSQIRKIQSKTNSFRYVGNPFIHYNHQQIKNQIYLLVGFF